MSSDATAMAFERAGACHYRRHLAEACDCVWGDEELREVFGNAYPLLAYYDHLSESPDRYGLFRMIVGQLNVLVRVIHYYPAGSMASSEGDDYYCQFADEVRTDRHRQRGMDHRHYSSRRAGSRSVQRAFQV